MGSADNVAQTFGKDKNYYILQSGNFFEYRLYSKLCARSSFNSPEAMMMSDLRALESTGVGD